MEHKVNMDTDPEAAYERRRQREAARRRREESRREDLCHAASRMIPDHGLAVRLGQIAVVAGLSRQVATSLYASVADLAVDVVCRAWRALIETTAPTPNMTTQDFLTRLIQALRADKAAHQVWQTIQCGLLSRNRRTMDDAEAFLAMAIGQALREIRPDLPHHAATEVGDRVLSLARHAAYAASAPDPRAEAALIAGLLPHFYKASAEATAPAEAVADTVAAAAPIATPHAEVPAPPAWTLPRPLPNGHDPPRHVVA
jgi:DNA-binding transcriptional regulator YbjK